ncbi:NUDIX domain-containing protein [Flaviflexus huanghaiensis]|uniref:NUDIX domain-containing protein n=1 Tax=Flaviflexus huanghaiensis TaxID=1111473 RepID=UPI0015FDCC30
MSLVAAAAIVDSLDKPTRLLAAQRSYPKDLAGKWELPGGKVEDGEDPESACRREIREELGVTATLDRLVLGPDGDWPIGRHTMRVWLATIDSEPQCGPDHEELRWCSARETAGLDWLPGDIPLAAKLASWMVEESNIA